MQSTRQRSPPTKCDEYNSSTPRMLTWMVKHYYCKIDIGVTVRKGLKELLERYNKCLLFYHSITGDFLPTFQSFFNISFNVTVKLWAKHEISFPRWTPLTPTPFDFRSNGVHPVCNWSAHPPKTPSLHLTYLLYPTQRKSTILTHCCRDKSDLHINRDAGRRASTVAITAGLELCTWHHQLVHCDGVVWYISCLERVKIPIRTMSKVVNEQITRMTSS